MVKRIVYRTKISVYDMILDECKKNKCSWNKLEEVWLYGIIEYHSQRKLLGIIPLPNKYVYKVYPRILVRNTYNDMIYDETPRILSFCSKRQLMWDTLTLESRLRNKCEEFRTVG